MEKIVLHGRKVVGGVIEGEALVTKETISGWGGIDVKTGTIIDWRDSALPVRYWFTTVPKDLPVGQASFIRPELMAWRLWQWSLRRPQRKSLWAAW